MSARRALFALYPGTAALSHVELLDAPTPVVRVGGELADGIAGLWFKRDDISASAYGGNKVRKLEFTLGRAIDEKRKTVITLGALGSNHVLATAIHGAACGLEVHAILTPQVATGYLAPNLAADLAAGATLHPVTRAENAPRAAAALRAELRERDGVEPAVLPFGGTSAEAEAGFVSAALELCAQVESGLLPEPDLVYVPLGSTGTAVGLAIGFAAAGVRTRVVGVRVIPADVVSLEQLREVAQGALTLLDWLDASFPTLRPEDLPLEVREGFLGSGYAVPTKAGREAIELAARAGIVLESTYTAKTLAALLADARAGSLAGANVVFWNTYNSRPLTGSEARAPGIPPEFAGFVIDDA